MITFASALAIVDVVSLILLSIVIAVEGGTK